MIFLCGSLIAGAVTTIYLKWINPDFIVNLLHRAIEVWRSSDLSNAREMAAVAQKMIDYNLVPSAIEIAVEMIWLSVFSGSILSLLMSLLARSKSVRRNAEIP